MFGRTLSRKPKDAATQQLRLTFDRLRPKMLPRVLEIERESFDPAWSKEDFARVSRRGDCLGNVALAGRRVVGFVIYDVQPESVSILNLAVADDSRHLGVATALVSTLVQCLSESHCRTVTAAVRETNLPAQLFFRSLKFRVEEILRQASDKMPYDTEEDAYLFVKRLTGDADDQCRGR